jgi:hypothetical protein
VAGFCEHGKEPLGSIKGGEFHDSFLRRTLLRGVSSIIKTPVSFLYILILGLPTVLGVMAL